MPSTPEGGWRFYHRWYTTRTQRVEVMLRCIGTRQDEDQAASSQVQSVPCLHGVALLGAMHPIRQHHEMTWGRMYQPGILVPCQTWERQQLDAQHPNVMLSACNSGEDSVRVCIMCEKWYNGEAMSA